VGVEGAAHRHVAEVRAARRIYRPAGSRPDDLAELPPGHPIIRAERAVRVAYHPTATHQIVPQRLHVHEERVVRRHVPEGRVAWYVPGYIEAEHHQLGCLGASHVVVGPERAVCIAADYAMAIQVL